MSQKEAEAAKIFKALADENRVKLVMMLSDGPKSATALLSKMPFSQPTLSHHLSILCESGVLDAQRSGKSVMYNVNADTASKAAQILGIFGNPAKSEAPKSQKQPQAPKKTAPVEKKPSTPQADETPAQTPRRRMPDFDLFD